MVEVEGVDGEVLGVDGDVLEVGGGSCPLNSDDVVNISVTGE